MSDQTPAIAPDEASPLTASTVRTAVEIATYIANGAELTPQTVKLSTTIAATLAAEKAHRLDRGCPTCLHMLISRSGYRHCGSPLVAAKAYLPDQDRMQLRTESCSHAREYGVCGPEGKLHQYGAVRFINHWLARIRYLRSGSWGA